MPKARDLQPLPVPPGAGALDVLPALTRALEGDGPALLPVASGNTAESQRLVAELAEGPLAPGEDDPDDPTALVIATSGSTGTPKGVLLPASALRASADATHRRLGGPGSWLLAMPAHHVAGIQVLVRSVLAGAPPHAVDTSGGFRSDRFTAAAREALATDGPHYTALVPTQLSRLLNDGEGLAALREFDAVLLGGAATPPALRQRATDNGVRVTTTYGMSETSGGCVYDGQPLDIAKVGIEEEPGPIRLAGPMLARGYRHQPEAAAFSGGWFSTGDLGRWQGDRLEVLGRSDDMIITGGVNVAPLPVERLLAEQAGVREACVLGVPDPEWGQAVVAAIVPADPDEHPSEEALRTAVRTQLGGKAAPKRIAFLAELPLRGPGKPDRRALAELLGS